MKIKIIKTDPKGKYVDSLFSAELKESNSIGKSNLYVSIKNIFISSKLQLVEKSKCTNIVYPQYL